MDQETVINWRSHNLSLNVSSIFCFYFYYFYFTKWYLLLVVNSLSFLSQTSSLQSPAQDASPFSVCGIYVYICIYFLMEPYEIATVETYFTYKSRIVISFNLIYIFNINESIKYTGLNLILGFFIFYLIICLFFTYLYVLEIILHQHIGPDIILFHVCIGMAAVYLTIPSLMHTKAYFQLLLLQILPKYPT